MLYFKGSLLFIYVWIIIEITPLKIQQNMISSGENEAGAANGRNEGEINGGIELETTPKPTTTTTSTTTTTPAPTCPELASKGYSQYNSKWMKIHTASISYSACESLCIGEDTRLVTIKSASDETAVGQLFQSVTPPANSAFLGLKQQTLDTYIWSDGTTMTVNYNDGTTDLVGNYNNWFGPGDYDSGGTLDTDVCFAILSLKWLENSCDDVNVNYCACECKY